MYRRYTSGWRGTSSLPHPSVDYHRHPTISRLLLFLWEAGTVYWSAPASPQTPLLDLDQHSIPGNDWMSKWWVLPTHDLLCKAPWAIGNAPPHSMSMKIVTWNVQGLKSRLDLQNIWKLRRDLEEYLLGSVADIIPFQPRIPHTIYTVVEVKEQLSNQWSSPVNNSSASDKLLAKLTRAL